MMQFNSRKGQSAIEYLTTYGWMLIVIIVAIGALMQMGVFSQCSTTAPSQVGKLTIDTWGFQDNSTVTMEVSSMAQDQITITDVNWGLDSASVDDSTWSNVDVPAGGSQSFTFDLTSELTGGACANGELTFTYDEGGATGLKKTGDRNLGDTAPE